jgi:hypothetical protein
MEHYWKSLRDSNLPIYATHPRHGGPTSIYVDYGEELSDRLFMIVLVLYPSIYEDQCEGIFSPHILSL